MRTVLTIALLTVLTAGCRTPVKREETEVMSLARHRSPMAIIQQRVHGGRVTASAWFERFEAGYRFRIGLTHPEAEWVAPDGWRIRLEDAAGRQAQPVALTPSDVITSRRRPIRVSVSGQTPPAMYMASLQPDNAMDRRVTGGRRIGTRAIQSAEVSTSHIDVDFRAPELDVAAGGRITLVMTRGDDVLRFTWNLVEP